MEGEFVALEILSIMQTDILFRCHALWFMALSVLLQRAQTWTWIHHKGSNTVEATALSWTTYDKRRNHRWINTDTNAKDNMNTGISVDQALT